MRTLIIYETEYGNTERIARAIAEALSEHGESRVAPIEGVAGLDAGELDLLIVGAPTQRHGLPAPTRELFEDIPHQVLNGVRALAFDTRYHRTRWITGSAAKEIAGLLRKAGCRLLAPPESFFVAGAGGPLEPGEEDRARAWALSSLGRTQREALR